MPKAHERLPPEGGDGSETECDPNGLTALEISRMVLLGRLSGLPRDRGAIHKLAKAEHWDYTVATKRGGPAKFFRVPERYFQSIEHTSEGDRGIDMPSMSAPPPPPVSRRPSKADYDLASKASSKRIYPMTDEARKIGLQTVALIDDRIPALRRLYGDDRYEKIYLAVHRLIEKGVDQKSIGETIKELLHFEVIERH